MSEFILKPRGYAKINLSLEVVRKREDLYHEIKTIYQTIDLYNTLIFKKQSKDNGFLVQLMGRFAEKDIPIGKDNLIYKVLSKFLDNDIIDSYKVLVYKNFPSSSGLASPSAEASASLRYFYYSLKMDLSIEDMLDKISQVSSDAPFLLIGGTALGEGKGEKLTFLNPFKFLWVLVIKPLDIYINTKQAYNWIDEYNLFSDAKNTLILAEKIENRDYKDIFSYFTNSFQSVIEEKYPVVKDILKTAKSTKGSLYAGLTGKGPTIFVLYENFSDLEDAYNYFKKEKGLFLYLTRFKEAYF